MEGGREACLEVTLALSRSFTRASRCHHSVETLPQADTACRRQAVYSTAARRWRNCIAVVRSSAAG